MMKSFAIAANDEIDGSAVLVAAILFGPDLSR
jgi:hypothetical protein